MRDLDARLGFVEPNCGASEIGHWQGGKEGRLVRRLGDQRVRGAARRGEASTRRRRARARARVRGGPRVGSEVCVAEGLTSKAFVVLQVAARRVALGQQ